MQTPDKVRKNTIFFEIDESPLSLHNPKQMDYVGCMVRSAFSEPLLKTGSKTGEVMPAACSHWEHSADELTHIFFIDPKKKWSNGDPLESRHFLERLIQLARHPYWATHCKYISEVRIKNERILIIKLKEKVGYIANLAATIDFAPIWKKKIRAREAQRIFNGPYVLKSYKSGIRYNLCPNPYYLGSNHRPFLSFLVNRSPNQSTLLFDQGKIDVSCNTAFPLNEITSRSSDSQLRISASPIFMQMEINPEGQECLRDKNFRRGLSLSVNRSRIAKELCGGVIVADHQGPVRFSHLMVHGEARYNISDARHCFRSAARPSKALRINFNDYYPNRIILQKIRNHWLEEFGLATHLVSIPFASVPDNNWDLMLCLRLPAYDHPNSILELYSWAVRRLCDEATANRFHILLKIIRNNSLSHAREAILEASNIISDSKVILPLFHIPNIYLIRKSISGFHFPVSSSFDFTCLQ